ncbi:ABC transporter [Candidatus Hydrogenosomobacter endosymbioticus]|uniref:ABC transporter n=2 Tax=Candidatus Hydrogenosomobacter endosymbioticus TaxID=2558174 RepID=A0ABM7V9U6_9PROT|nr:ABC transporter [Candidatus Hydrogenosomobacter endosymbioticus]
MQSGFKDSLFKSVSNIPRKLDGDLFVIHKQTEAIWRGSSFPKYELMRACGHPDVKEVKKLYIGQAIWTNPQKKSKRALLVFGVAPDKCIISSDEFRSKKSLLTIKDSALFDDRSKYDFGPIKEMLKTGPIETEVNDYRIKVMGTFSLGTSFAASGNIVVSEDSFFKLFPYKSHNRVDVGMISIKNKDLTHQVKKDLQALLNQNVFVFTKKELIEHEEAYWRINSPIGFIFGFGTIMGLIVGMVIVYQILFTDITNHLNEYATLKAMGYPHSYLVKIVVCSSMILAIVGFIPGALASAALYKVTESVTYIPMDMTFGKILNVFSLIFLMCVASGILAMNKLKSIDPADMF